MFDALEALAQRVAVIISGDLAHTHAAVRSLPQLAAVLCCAVLCCAVLCWQLHLRASQ